MLPVREGMGNIIEALRPAIMKPAVTNEVLREAPMAEMAAEEVIRRTDERLVKSGIAGLDTVLGGGIPEKHIVLVTGGPGSGKTTFGLQFVANGARHHASRGLFISFEQPKDEILEEFLQFGWGLQELEKEDKLRIVSFAGTSLHMSQIWNEIEREINSFHPDRLVIDSIDALSVHLDLMTSVEILELIGVDSKAAGFMPTGEDVRRRTLAELFKRLKAFRFVSLMISERVGETGALSRDGISEFLADGVIVMSYAPERDNSFATLQVRKMRGVKHKRQAFQTILNAHGMAVNLKN